MQPFPRIVLIAGVLALRVSAQAPLSWEQVKTRFESSNPTLQASRLGTDAARTGEISAFLRPNPDLTISTDGNQLTRRDGVWRPFAGTQFSPGVSYLHEREGKRELRRDVARQGTALSETATLDQQRGMLFTLRSAFIQALQAKAVLANAKENLVNWDRELQIARSRLAAGDIAQVDLHRMTLLRAQLESDYETALVNLRTSKIQLLTMLNDRTPVDTFDITGPFDFSETIRPLPECRQAALEARPDLKAAAQTVELARLSHQLAVANGSADPTFNTWWTHNPSFNNPYAYNTLGASVSIPLRLFDRNQGEKARTQVEIGRTERLREASEAQVFSDVDSAWWTLVQSLNLLKPYKTTYLPLAEDTRNKVSFAYQNGGVSLLDFLDAEKSLRDTRLAYLNLIGAYLTAAAQMNMAAGREVIP